MKTLIKNVILNTRKKLVVELDSGGHFTAEQIEKDNIRTKEFESMNLTVLRICNLDIDRNFSGVCEYIELAVKNSLPQSATLTAADGGGLPLSLRDISLTL